MLGPVLPKYEWMKPLSRRNARSQALAALAVAGAAVLAGCGTRAVVKPSSTPLPGLQRDIHAAQNAVATTERQAQGDATTSVGNP
jgi:hypothetical protein